MNSHSYTQAAGLYDKHAKTGGSQRELEGRLLIKAANQLQSIQDNWDETGRDELDDALTYNRRLWVLFYDAALENYEGDRPADIRSNIVNLSNFIFKQTIQILANPKKENLKVLIDINREIAAGLMSQPASETKPDQGEQNPGIASEKDQADSTGSKSISV